MLRQKLNQNYFGCFLSLFPQEEICDSSFVLFLRTAAF